MKFLKYSVLWLLVAVMLCSALVGCNEDPADPNGGQTPDAPAATPDDSNPSDTPSNTEPVGTKKDMEADLSKYQIIYADGQVVNAAATTLQTALEDKGINMKSPKKMSAVTADDASLEILIGETDRTASASAVAKLVNANDFVILFEGNKIAIHAKAKGNLSDAVDYFLATYVNAETGALSAKDGDAYVGSISMIRLSDNGTAKIALVKGYRGLYDTLAFNLEGSLKNRLGSSVTIETIDDLADRPTDKTLILIGNDLDPEKYPEIAQISAAWGEFDYGFAKVGEHLVVFGNNAQVMEDAVRVAQTQISRETETVDGSVWIKMVGDIRKTDDSFLTDYPRFDKELSKSYYNNNSEMAYEYKNVTMDDFNGYVAKLAKAGYIAQYGGYQIGEHKFATCVNPDKGQVHITYFTSGVGNMTVFTSKLEETAAMPEDTYNPETDKVSETIFHVMSQDYSNRGDKIWDGNGLNYIVTLEDGRFVIFDGGYSNTADADNIYKYMKAMNKRADGKIIVAAWFMSHPHDDHLGAFQTFVAKGYHGEVTIEYFIANSPSVEMYGSDHWMNKDMPSLVKRAGAKLIKPHTGQLLTLCGTKFEILLSHETMSGSYGGGNDASTVVRIIENGHSILLTMDAANGMCAKMIQLYGKDLKSDVLQVNHHGQSGGTTAFFEKVAPTYALYTTSQDAFADYKGGRINGGGNADQTAQASNLWIRENVRIKNCFVADDVIEQILMPEDGEIVINTDTGYFVNNSYPAGDKNGLLQGPNVE